MKRNTREKLKNYTRNNFKSDNGITLVALIVTIIVLLILAAVSLSAVFNKNGIFSRAEQATKLYGKEKSRDELTIALADAEMKKYTSGLTEEELNEILNQAGQVDDTDNTRVTVDGHIWQIDRDKLEIVDYLGEDDGIEIRYTIEGNDDYIIGTPNITVHVTVRNNKGALDINSIQITKNGAPLTGIAISNNGEFELSVTEEAETIFTVSAKNSKGEQSTPRTIKITPKIDTTPPVISGQTVTLVEENGIRMKIKIKADVADAESGIASFTYAVTGAGTVTPTATALTSGVPLELTTSTPGNYTVTFTATNVAGKSTTTEEITVTTTDAISVADLKSKINGSNYPEYLGMKVNYNPEAGGTWRVFYYDASGEYGDGAGTIYLKRDYDTTTTLSSYTSHVPEDGGALMRQLNPEWAKTDNGKKAATAWLENEHCASWLCDKDLDVWKQYKTNDAKYAIGAAPIEMWTKAYNAYLRKYEPSKLPSNLVTCGIVNTIGYGWGLNNGSLADRQYILIDTSIPQSAVISTGYYQWLASPSTYSSNTAICFEKSTDASYCGYERSNGVCPVVCLNN